MRIHLLTIFPEFFQSPLQESILKRAQTKGLVEFNIVNIRDFATDKHQITDDRPYGGGPGMVMKIEPIHNALKSLGAQPRTPGKKIVLTSAKGRLFTQPVVREYARLDELIIICGHYEGVDERVVEHLIDEEVRIGDYVLTGGEPAAVVMTDAVTRLVDGVLGNEESNINESHREPGYFAHPQYTRPEVYESWSVPEVLLQGNHKEIEVWRQTQAKNGSSKG